MKKKTAFFSIIALAGIIAAAGIYQSQNNRLSYLTLANIEALADEEQTVDIPCVPDENETCTYPVRLADGTEWDRTDSRMRHI